MESQMRHTWHLTVWTSGDMVEIRKAEAQTRIIKLNQDSFLETLRRKMKGN